MAGDTAFYAEICVILLDLVLGVIFDTVGRKIPTVLGFMLMGTAIILTPFFTQIYPQYLILRICMSLGIIPGVNTPLLPDYVYDKSLGLANAYVSFIPLSDVMDYIVKRNRSIGYHRWNNRINSTLQGF